MSLKEELYVRGSSRCCLELNLDKGTFKIFKGSFNGFLLAESTNLMGKEVRPFITLNEGRINVSTFEKT